MKNMKAQVACTKTFETNPIRNPVWILKMLVLFGWCVAVLGANTGCSVVMAAKQPDEKNIDLFAQGTSRDSLLAEFGPPINSENRDGKKTDIFKFIQGYSTGAKAGRALFHGAADVFTLGLWEVVGTPVEGAFDGDEMAFKVTYDASDRVEEWELLQGPKPEEKSMDQEECDSATESCI